MGTDFQKQRKCLLCHCLCAVARHIGNRDPALCGCFHINDIVAGRKHADITKLRTDLHDLLRNDRFIGQRNLTILQTFHDILRLILCVLIYGQISKYLKLIPV